MTRFDDFEPIDVWGFAEAFTLSRFLGQGLFDLSPYPFQVIFMAQAAKEHFDVLMVPGGAGTRCLINDQKVLEFLKAMDTKVGIVASVCTGAALLAKIGLLDGKPAATNHAAFNWVRM